MHTLAVALTPRRKLTSFPAEVWIVSVATFLSRSVGFLALYSTVFFRSIGMDATALSAALFISGFTGVLGSLAGGWLATRYGATTVLITGTALNVPLLFILGLISTEPVAAVVVASLSVAVTQSFAGPAAALITGSAYAGSTVTVVAFQRIFLSVGVTVAPLAVAVVGQGDFSSLFFLSSFGSLITAVLLLSERHRLLTAELRAAAPEPAAAPAPVPAPSGSGSAVATAVATVRAATGAHPARVWTVIIAFGTAMAIYVQSMSGIPLSLDSISGGQQLYGVLIAFNAVFIIAFELPLSFLTARLRWNYALGLGIVVTGVGLAVCGTGSDWTGCIIGFAVFSLGEAIFIPQASAAIATLSSPSANARNQGYLSAAQSIGFAIGPGIGAFGVLHARTLHWVVVAHISLIAGAAAVAAGIIKKRSAVRVG